MLLIDCDTCPNRRPAACGDCMVSALIGPPSDQHTFDDAEGAALLTLAGQGMVAPLRAPVQRPASRRVGAGDRPPTTVLVPLRAPRVRTR